MDPATPLPGISSLEGPDRTWDRMEQGTANSGSGGVAEIRVPKGYAFTDGGGARRFLELTHNPASNDEVGLLPIDKQAGERWFMLFEFDEIGYVSDSDKSNLDAPALLKTLTTGTEKANEKRKEKGCSAFHIAGWYKEPFYAEDTLGNFGERCGTVLWRIDKLLDENSG
jgi:uncharacterized membrane-anchored protein